MKDLIKGGIITLVIGGSVFTFSQSDLAKNFAKETGMTQEQAEQYIDSVDKDELKSFDKIGSDIVKDGEEIITNASEIDCTNYEYEWESTSFSCQTGKKQLEKIGNDSILLGKAYIILSTDSASEIDINKAMTLIDQLNSDYELEIINFILDAKTIDENKKTNYFNKSVLKSALESK